MDVRAIWGELSLSHRLIAYIAANERASQVGDD